MFKLKRKVSTDYVYAVPIVPVKTVKGGLPVPDITQGRGRNVVDVPSLPPRWLFYTCIGVILITTLVLVNALSPSPPPLFASTPRYRLDYGVYAVAITHYLSGSCSIDVSHLLDMGEVKSIEVVGDGVAKLDRERGVLKVEGRGVYMVLLKVGNRARYVIAFTGTGAWEHVTGSYLPTKGGTYVPLTKPKLVLVSTTLKTLPVLALPRGVGAKVGGKYVVNKYLGVLYVTLPIGEYPIEVR
ncbi:MAG: hypothetical protein DRJ40_11740 [Thermoprotei archaeon]|nr:MAG: hypothetical protein DRJ40_11740 [Thermoprotei archaeon]